MPHPFIDAAHLKDIHADRFRRDAHLLHGIVNLPENTAVRAEITAMLDNAERDPAAAPARPVGSIRRFRVWIPRWVLWLRTMPLP